MEARLNKYYAVLLLSFICLAHPDRESSQSTEGTYISSSNCNYTDISTDSEGGRTKSRSKGGISSGNSTIVCLR